MRPDPGTDLTDDEPDFIEALVVDLGPAAVGTHLDKALATAAPELSRARIQALMAEGRITFAGEAVVDPEHPAVLNDHGLPAFDPPRRRVRQEPPGLNERQGRSARLHLRRRRRQRQKQGRDGR